MTKKFLQAKVKIQKSGDVITVVASDETLDRHGEVLPIDQWDLSMFKQSPRMLVDHNHQVEKIVGKWVNPRIQGKELLLDAQFHDFTPLAKAVKQMVEEGYLNTVSVGFIPHGPEKDGGREVFELIETSWVTVPANPNAQVQAAFKALEGKELTADEKKKLEEYVGKDFDEADELEDSDDILPDKDEDEQDGDVPVKSIEEFKTWQEKNKEEVVLLCEAQFISKLITDSEQLQTLTADKKAKVEIAKRNELLRLSLKAVAGHTSHLLREMNKKNSI